MRVHNDWSTGRFAAPPIADHVGPFPQRPFLETWADHFGDGGVTTLVEDTHGLVALHERDGVVMFAGHDDVTDYHAPLGTGISELLGSHLASLPAGTEVRFDSLPAEAAEIVTAAVGIAGAPAPLRQHEVAPIITLPETFDAYLATLTKKQRHEVRRKRRRFEEALGPAALERHEGDTAAARFAEMHRRASGDKGAFMNPAMEAFFVDLVARAGAVVDVLVTAGGRAHAMAFGFEDTDTYYLYNSAFEPADREHSPGIVLMELLIRGAIAAGKTRLDLLKGDEAYKYRLGGVPRPLYVVAGTVGGRT